MRNAMWACCRCFPLHALRTVHLRARAFICWHLASSRNFYHVSDPSRTSKVLNKMMHVRTDPCDAACEAAFTVTQNAYYTGTNLAGTPLTTAHSMDECQYACYTRTDCAAYSYSGECFLMSAVTGLTPSTAYNTGAKNIGEHGRWCLWSCAADAMLRCAACITVMSASSCSWPPACLRQWR